MSSSLVLSSLVLHGFVLYCLALSPLCCFLAVLVRLCQKCFLSLSKVVFVFVKSVFCLCQKCFLSLLKVFFVMSKVSELLAVTVPSLPSDSSSRGGDVAVYFFDIKPTELAYSFL